MSPGAEPWWDARRTAGACGGAAVLVLAMVLGSPLTAFVDVASMLAVLGGGALAGLATVGPGWRALPHPWTALPPSARERERSLTVVRAVRRALWSMGLLASLVLVIQFCWTTASNPIRYGSVYYLQPAALGLLCAVLAELFVLSPLELPLRLQRHGLPAERPTARDPALASQRAPLLAIGGLGLLWISLFIDVGGTVGLADSVSMLVPAGAGCLWLAMVGPSWWTLRAAQEGICLDASALAHAEEVGRALRRAVWLVALAMGLSSVAHGLHEGTTGPLWLATSASLTAALIDLLAVSPALAHVRVRRRARQGRREAPAVGSSGRAGRETEVRAPEHAPTPWVRYVLPRREDTMDLRRVVGAVGALAMLAMAVLVGSPLGVFLDLPSALLVFGGGALAWLAVVGSRWRALPAALRAARPSPAQLDAAEDVARSGRRAVWLIGLASVIIGVIQMQWSIDDPDALGPALAVALLPLFYAGLVDLFGVSPLLTRVQLRRTEARPVPGLDADHQQQLDAALDALRTVRQRQAAREG